MTDLARELEIAERVAAAIETKKPLEKWGMFELGKAGIFLAIESLAENERHHEAVEKLLGEIRDRQGLLFSIPTMPTQPVPALSWICATCGQWAMAGHVCVTVHG